MFSDVIFFVLLFGLPALPAIFVSLIVHKLLMRQGNRHRRLFRILSFAVTYIAVFSALALFCINLMFQR